MHAADKLLLDALQDAVRDLVFISETDAVWSTVRWPHDSAPTPDAVRDWHGTPNAPATYDDFARLMRGPTTAHVGLTADGLTRVQRYRDLKALLEANLADLRVIRLGRVSLTIYIFGRTPNGIWLGLTTQATET